MECSLFYFPFENCFVIPLLFYRKGTIPIQNICAISVFRTKKDHYSNFFNSEISLFLSVTLAFSKPQALDSGVRAKRNNPEKTQKKPITSNFNTIKYNLDYRLTLFIKARNLKVSYDILRSHFISDAELLCVIKWWRVKLGNNFTRLRLGKFLRFGRKRNYSLISRVNHLITFYYRLSIGDELP